MHAMPDAELRQHLRVFRAFRKKFAAAKTIAAERALLAEFRSYLAAVQREGDDDGT